MKTKKGFELNALMGIGITFVVVAMILSFGSTITKEVQEDQLELGSLTVDNKTIASALTTGIHVLLEDRPSCSISNSSISAINVTGSNLLVYDIYNWTKQDCTIVWQGMDIATEGLRWTYVATFIVETGAYNATKGGLEGLNEFADWLPTLALIIIAAVIIGIIVRYFGMGGT